MEKIRIYQDLIVWQKAHKLVLEIYKLTRTFPSEERFGLVSQIRRCAVSIPANIAEGFCKKGVKDKLNYYNIAQGSTAELDYYIVLSKDLGFIKREDKISDNVKDVIRLLQALINSINAKTRQQE